MIEWWQAREPREQFMLRLLGALFALAVIIQFGFVPLLQNKAVNEMQNLKAMQSLDAVTAASSTSENGTALLAGQSADVSVAELRTAAHSLAARRGLAISRIQGSGDSEVIIIMDNADPQLLYAWLADIQVQHGARPSSISMSGDASGGVRASIAFSGARG